MRYNALVLVVLLLAAGGLLAISSVRDGFGIGLDDSWQLALIHAELALAPLIFRARSGGREAAAGNLASAFACWACGGAVILMFSFASMRDAGIDTRALSACVWLCVGGLLSLGARFGQVWVFRARVLVLCAFGLPALWHYLMLEYGGASAGHLDTISPSWALATGGASLVPLLVAGLLAWVAALAVPRRAA